MDVLRGASRVWETTVELGDKSRKEGRKRKAQRRRVSLYDTGVTVATVEKGRERQRDEVAEHGHPINEYRKGKSVIEGLRWICLSESSELSRTISSKRFYMNYLARLKRSREFCSCSTVVSFVFSNITGV